MKTTAQSAQFAGTIVADNLELPLGAEFTVEPGPVEDGQLAMVRIGELETVGRYYRFPVGDCIVQPGLLTLVKDYGPPVRVVGRVILE